MIVHIVESTATGTLSMLRLSANAQAEAGQQVKVIYSIRPETPAHLRELFHPAVELINIQMDGIGGKLKALLAIRTLLKAERPVAVFMHSSFAGFVGRIAALGLPGQYFYLPHCISFMRRDVSAVKRLLFVALEWAGALKRASYVACSASEGKEIAKYIPFRRCVVIDNAVDVDKWLYQGDWAERQSVVVTVGQIRLQKDPARFADIARRVLRQRDDVRFVWVGDGDADFKQELLAAGVEVSGWKKPDEVKALLQSSRYYLSTSLWEGMPVSPIEAMLSGCCNFLSDCAGNVDIVHHNSTGFIFSSPQDAADQIVAALDNQALAQKVAGAGQEHSKQSYSQQRYIREFQGLVSKEN